MSVTFAIIIAAAAIGGGVLISKSVKQAKERRVKDEENWARMASLRDKKEQKRQERLAREEQKKREKEALEEQHRLDEIKRQEEEQKRIEEYKKQLAEQDMALNRLGLTTITMMRRKKNMWRIMSTHLWNTRPMRIWILTNSSNMSASTAWKTSLLRFGFMLHLEALCILPSMKM